MKKQLRRGKYPAPQCKIIEFSVFFHEYLSANCELSVVVPDESGEKVKTVARIKTRTYTAIIPPTMKAIAFQTLFARLFLIASCSLILESCSAKASGCSAVSIFEPSSWLTGTSKISASFIGNSESGTERPVSLN